MVLPHAKRPFCPDPSVTLQVLRLRKTPFEVGLAVECSYIEPQPAHRLMGSVPQTAHRSLTEVLAMRQLPGLLGLALSGSGPSVAALATAGFDEIGKAIAGCFEHAE